MQELSSWEAFWEIKCQQRYSCGIWCGLGGGYLHNVCRTGVPTVVKADVSTVLPLRSGYSYFSCKSNIKRVVLNTDIPKYYTLALNELIITMGKPLGITTFRII